MPTFEKLRVSLAREEDLPILDAAEHKDVARTRREFLDVAFSSDLAFLHDKTRTRFEFVPLPIDGDYVAGIFKRPRPVLLHDASLQPYDAENYEGSLVILSTSKDQIIWAENNPRLGSNKALLESFFNNLRTKTDIRDWKVYVEYLTDEQEYKSVITERRAEIAKIAFTFLPPNALSADDEIYNLIKAIHGEAHPETQQHVYKAPPGTMNPDTEHMNASAKIAMKGGGEADVRTADNRVLYSSRRARRITREVAEGDMPTPDHAPFVRRVRDWLFGE